MIPVRDGSLPSSATVVAPTRLAIPAIDLTARITPAGVDARTGEFAVPPSVDTVGWYRFGPGLDARAGSVVVAGHVDSAEQGAGAFFRLRELDRGDEIVVTGADGRTGTWRVVGKQVWPKTSVPLDRLFARDGPVRLTLITCGGEFDAARRSYRDNVVITAEPGGP